jgi:hypothetical protein
MARGTPQLASLIVAAAAALALPCAAAAGVPTALYPVQAEGLTEGERSEVQGVVESALGTAERRGVLELRSPLLLPAKCKAPITVGCVATQAKGGVVLYAKAKRRGAQILVTILFVDAMGRKTRATAFPVDLFIQNLRPANDAIATIEAELVSGALEEPTPAPAPPAPAAKPLPEKRVAERPAPPARPAPPVAAAEPPRPPPPAEPPPAPPPVAKPPPVEPPAPPPVVAKAPPAAPPAPAPRAPEPKPAREPEPPEVAAVEPAGATSPIDLNLATREEPGRGAKAPAAPAPAPAAGPTTPFSRTVGRWATGAGLATIGVGAVFGLSGLRLADALDHRYEAGTLRPGDRKLYDTVDRYRRVANTLFIAGGAATAVGLGFLVVAPAPGGATVAIGGSF